MQRLDHLVKRISCRRTNPTNYGNGNLNTQNQLPWYLQTCLLSFPLSQQISLFNLVYSTLGALLNLISASLIIQMPTRSSLEQKPSVTNYIWVLVNICIIEHMIILTIITKFNKLSSLQLITYNGTFILHCYGISC